MADENEIEELEPSELGTQVFWNKTYSLEKRNYEAHGDVGEIWFGEDSALRIIRWICSSELLKPSDRIIDLGCGNGMFLIELAREGFTDLTGVDYSDNAIDLARSVAKSQDLLIKYEVCDILSTKSDAVEYAAAHDKGTYDAISLDPEDSKAKREKYIENVWSFLSTDGLLLLTSCNWTESELRAHFKSKFAVHKVIPTPTFQFGGKTGNIVTSVVFQKIQKT